MKIAYICTDPGIPVFGSKGASIHVQEVLRAFLKRSDQVTLFATRWGDHPPADLAGIEQVRLPSPPIGEMAARERWMLAQNHILETLLEAYGPFDLYYERYALWSYAGMETAHRLNCPGVLEVNAPLIEEQAIHRGLVHHTQAQEVAERVFGAAGLLVAVSDGVATYLNTFEEAQGRVKVFPNGVNPDRFPLSVPSATRRPFTVGFVGTLKPWHGVDGLVTAFADFHRHYPDSHLLIVGDGPERERIESALVTAGIEKAATLTGAVSPSDVPQWIQQMDVAVAPYPPQDPFYFSPLKLFEYMVTQRAVVASDIGQIPMVVQQGTTGLLYPPGDIEALTVALTVLYQQPSLRHQLGAAAREYVLAHHTWDAVVENVIRNSVVEHDTGVDTGLKHLC
jgi:glycosyltransferase involved in cell wall biosynthesis